MLNCGSLLWWIQIVRARPNSSNNLSCNSLQLLKQTIIYLCNFWETLAGGDIMCVCVSVHRNMHVQECQGVWVCPRHRTTSSHKKVHTIIWKTWAARHWVPLKHTGGWAVRKWGNICHQRTEWAARWENGHSHKAGGCEVATATSVGRDQMGSGCSGMTPATPQRAFVVASAGALHLTQWRLRDPRAWARVSPPAGHNRSLSADTIPSGGLANNRPYFPLLT